MGERTAMACREFSLWYNERDWRKFDALLWLVGNSRYGTICPRLAPTRSALWLVGNSRYGTIQFAHFHGHFQLWLVGNSRYGTIFPERVAGATRYGL